jgi:quinol monooxygenase YgiN
MRLAKAGNVVEHGGQTRRSGRTNLMSKRCAAAAISVAALLCARSAGFAQSADQPTFVVTYIEAAPKAATGASELIVARCAAARKAPGLAQIEAFARTGYPSQFAMLEQWQSAKAREDYAATEETKTFLAKLSPLMVAGYDERIHIPLTVGASKPAPSDAVVALTHVDLIPTFKDTGTANVKAFGEQSRSSTGNLRFDVLTQASRTNHMTVVEGWSNQAAKDAHIAEPFVKSFRETLMPMSGSLYDERVYRPLHC